MELKKVYFKRVVNNGIRFVYVYNDKEGRDLKCMFNSTLTSLPNRRRKFITLNCCKFKCEFI